jgi:hypothetical protein
MISYEVRNTRGVVVRTFGDAKMARSMGQGSLARHWLGQLDAYAVETIRRERLLTDEPEITTARQIKRRAS